MLLEVELDVAEPASSPPDGDLDRRPTQLTIKYYVIFI